MALTDEAPAAESRNENVGRIEAIQGVVIEAVFPDKLPEINHAIKVRRPAAARGEEDIDIGAAEDEYLVCEVQQQLGRRPGPGGGAGHHRRPGPRRRGDRHRSPDHRSGRASHAGKDLQPAGRADRPRRPAGRGRRALADPSRGPQRRGDDPDDGDLRDRHQGDRPAGALRQGRQGRAVRRRRRRQDRDHPGADPQPRPGARRPVGVLRRRRALPRGQRPVAGDEGVRRARQDDPRLRADERAARRPYAGGPVGPDDGGVLPRSGGPGRAALHRQHLPLRPGGLGGLGAARPDALPGRLPADARVARWASCRSASPPPAGAR